MKHKLIAIKIAVTLIVISLICYKLPSFGQFLNDLKKMELIYYFYIFLIYVLIESMGALRINTLLKAQPEIQISFLTQFKVIFIGLFFNNFLPGATGGDLYRAYYLTHHTKDKKTEVVATIFIDRIIGIFSMVIIGIFFLFMEGIANPMFKPYFKYTILSFSGIITLIFLFSSKRIVSKIPYIKNILNVLPFKDTLIRVYNSFHLYHSHKTLIILSLLYSITLQSLAILIYLLIGNSIGINLSAIHYFSLIPLVFIVNALPISFGGIGVGESACVFFFAMVNVPTEKALALAVLFRIALILSSLVGGILYFSPGHKESIKEMQKEVSETEKAAGNF